MYCFGIDVGGTTVKCGLFQTDGTLVEKWEIPTRKENKGEYILPDVAETIQNKISEKGIDKAEVAGVGVGIPGPINAQGEAACAVNLYWGFRPVAKELSELTGLTAKAGNDANVAALGEAWRGAAAGSQNVIMVTLGTGVGGGIISDGRIVAGAHGAGGEIGHITVDPEGFECTCGKRGCLETVSSATGVVRLGRYLAEEYAGDSKLKAMLDNGEEVTSKDIFEMAQEDDPFALMVVDRVCFYLGLACGNLGNTLNPSSIVLGGGVSAAGEFLRSRVEKYFKEFTFPQVRESTKIKLAELGNEAGVIGAASLALKFA